MDEPSTVAPNSEDQELTSMLAGLNNGGTASAATPGPVAPTADPAAPVIPTIPTTDAVTTAPDLTPPIAPDISAVTPTTPGMGVPLAPDFSSTAAPGTAADPALDAIKKDALAELRPLVDKLNLPADEKFNILLLMIRSTDDHSLLNQAHEAAKQIPDDAKRAQALLEIVKEIDYLGQSKAQ